MEALLVALLEVSSCLRSSSLLFTCVMKENYNLQKLLLKGTQQHCHVIRHVRKGDWYGASSKQSDLP